MPPFAVVFRYKCFPKRWTGFYGFMAQHSGRVRLGVGGDGWLVFIACVAVEGKERKALHFFVNAYSIYYDYAALSCLRTAATRGLTRCNYLTTDLEHRVLRTSRVTYSGLMMCPCASLQLREHPMFGSKTSHPRMVAEA